MPVITGARLGGTELKKGYLGSTLLFDNSAATDGTPYNSPSQTTVHSWAHTVEAGKPLFVGAINDDGQTISSATWTPDGGGAEALSLVTPQPAEGNTTAGLTYGHGLTAGAGTVEITMSGPAWVSAYAYNGESTDIAVAPPRTVETFTAPLAQTTATAAIAALEGSLVVDVMAAGLWVGASLQKKLAAQMEIVPPVTTAEHHFAGSRVLMTADGSVQLGWDLINAGADRRLAHLVAEFAAVGASFPLVASFTPAVGAGGSDVVVPVPSGTQDGDLLIAVGGCDGGRTFDLHGSFTNLVDHAHTDANCHLRVMRRTAASEPASYTFTVTGGAISKLCGMIRISGWSGVETPVSAEGLSATPVCPTLALTGSNRLVLFVYAARNGAIDATDTGYPTEADAGLWARGEGTTAGVNLGAARLDVASGSSGTATWTAPAGSDRWVAATIGIIP